jgi:hypothetical protein
MSTIEVKAYLSGMFSDRRFHQTQSGLYRWVGTIDGVKIGIVLATRNPSFRTHALNRGDTESLLAAKRDGKVHEAWIVAATFAGNGGYTYVDAFEAAELHDKLVNQPARVGRNGPFWVLDDTIVVVDLDDGWM